MNGNWEPFWMGTDSRRLYAALHPATDAPSVGVVLVPPLLHEQPRSRRFLTEVANHFAALGLPSLRFDFYGTGDSSGNGEEVDFPSIRRDIALATATLRDRVQVRKLCLIAWRGSALPLLGASEARKNADLTVFWEPVTDGLQWLQQLMDADARERSTRPFPSKTGKAPCDGHLMGFPISRQLRDDLARVRPGVPPTPLDVETWTLVRRTSPDFPQAQQRVFVLPESGPTFSDGVAMDKMFFLTPDVRNVVNELGMALKDAMQP